MLAAGGTSIKSEAGGQPAQKETSFMDCKDLDSIDSAIKVLTEETRLSRGDAGLANLLSTSPESARLEFPDGQNPPGAIEVLLTSEDNVSGGNASRACPVRFLRNSDGTVSITGLGKRGPDFAGHSKISIKTAAKADDTIPRMAEISEPTVGGPVLIRKQLLPPPALMETSAGSVCLAKNQENSATISYYPKPGAARSGASGGPSVSAFAGGQIQKKLGRYPLMDSASKFGSAASLSPTLGRVSSGHFVARGGGLTPVASRTGHEPDLDNIATVGNLESVPRELYLRQISVLVQLAQAWLERANDLEALNANLCVEMKMAGLEPSGRGLEVRQDKPLAFWRQKALSLNAENLNLRKEVAAAARSRIEIGDMTAKISRAEMVVLKGKLANAEKEIRKQARMVTKAKDATAKVRKDLAEEVRERSRLLRRKRNRDRRVEIGAARRRWRLQVIKELVNQNKLHPDVLKRPRIYYPPHIGNRYIDAEGNLLPKPKPFANWNRKRGHESGKLVKDVRDLPPDAFVLGSRDQEKSSSLAPQDHRYQKVLDDHQQIAIIMDDQMVVTDMASIGGRGVGESLQDEEANGAGVNGAQFRILRGINDEEELLGTSEAASDEAASGATQPAASAETLSAEMRSAVLDAIHRMETGNFEGNNVKHRPYRWQGKGPKPKSKDPVAASRTRRAGSVSKLRIKNYFRVTAKDEEDPLVKCEDGPDDEVDDDVDDDEDYVEDDDDDDEEDEDSAAAAAEAAAGGTMLLLPVAGSRLGDGGVEEVVYYEEAAPAAVRSVVAPGTGRHFSVTTSAGSGQEIIHYQVFDPDQLVLEPHGGDDGGHDLRHQQVIVTTTTSVAAAEADDDLEHEGGQQVIETAAHHQHFAAVPVVTLQSAVAGHRRLHPDNDVDVLMSFSLNPASTAGSAATATPVVMDEDPEMGGIGGCLGGGGHSLSGITGTIHGSTGGRSSRVQQRLKKALENGHSEIIVETGPLHL